MVTLNLPCADRTLQPLTLRAPSTHLINPSSFNRKVYAAAHVVVDPFADVDPRITPAIDWD